MDLKKNGFKPEGKYMTNMYTKLRNIKFEARKLVQGACAFKVLNEHCDFNKAGCRMPTGYQDLP